MAAKSKKRLSKTENKILKLEKLELKDVICSICQSILVEPVTLPCYHDFCLRCFNGSVENNALCCPLCRLRIGSWLRTSTRKKSIVNTQLWEFIKKKFPAEIGKKNSGEDVCLSPEKPILRLSEPGEIRSEYEAELRRLRAERLRLEQEHFHETELLIKKLHKEEEDAHKKYLESLKHDEILAQQVQESLQKETDPSTSIPVCNGKNNVIKQRLKPTKIDGYLFKVQAPVIESPLLTEDNTTTDGSTPKVTSNKCFSAHSPEMVPNYSKQIKKNLDKKNKTFSSIWNKENGEIIKIKKEDSSIRDKEAENIVDKSCTKTKNNTQSLLVSLPLPCSGILQHKSNLVDNRNFETGSVDSMRQELCYFKPIEGTTPTSFNTIKGLPLRVPGIKAEKQIDMDQDKATPTRAQYVEGLCRLRNLSLSQKLPSAFVIALSILKVQKESPGKCTTITRSKVKKSSPSVTVVNKQYTNVDGITKINVETNLRRTRSMGSITKDENEVTPKKKCKERKACSERKPYLRSDSKKIGTSKRDVCSPPLYPESINNNKVNLVVKNLSSPLEKCDVKKILREQIRIEKIIEQEKNDFELARKMEAEWNGRRQLRRTATKRQVTINYALRPAKKLKV